MDSIGSRLDRHHGIGMGFDSLRVFLAMLVLLNHSFLIADGSYALIDKYHLNSIFNSAVPLFFSLSGFLIAGSAQRLRLKDFLLNRGLRIIPALAVEIMLSAVLLGALLTNLPLHTYYTDVKFFSYFLNIVAYIHYELPGVFLTNPHPIQVNGSLWTVPWEIGCYALISFIIYSGAIKDNKRFVTFTTLFLISYICISYLTKIYFPSATAGDDSNATFMGKVLAKIWGDHGFALLIYFLAGILFYNLRHRIAYSPLLLLAAMLAILLITETGIFDGPLKHLLLAPEIAYIISYLGVSEIPSLPIYKNGDYSYGIYLYGYVIQQTLVKIEGGGKMNVFQHFIISAILSTLVAMVSWHSIEKPILGLRKKFSFTARKTEATANEWNASHLKK